MKCQDPTLCYTAPDGKKFYRNFSLASPVIKMNHQKVFNCGKCLTCRKKKSTELAVRCVLHASLYEENCFLTLTYDEKKPGYHNQLHYKDIQDLKKRLRSYCDYHFGKKIQIFNVHEYGRNGKKHWHLLVFNHDFSIDHKNRKREIYTIKNGNILYTAPSLSELWPHGFSTIGNVTEASAMYQAQYTQKDFKNGNENNSKKSKSNHSGLGKEYFEKNYKQILSLGFIPFNNKKIPLPRYFEKLAHKHFAHFYDQSYFFDLPDRKKRYSPFKPGEENLEIANLFKTYQEKKNEKIKEIETEWNSYISDFIFSDEKTDFQKSNENKLYDLKNKNNKEQF